MQTVNTLYQIHRRRCILLIILFVAMLLLAAFIVITIGATGLSINQVWTALLTAKAGPSHLVIWEIRLPRLVGALLGGCSLSLAGTVLQAVLKNPLAAPTTLGIAQGAAFGAALGITLTSASMGSAPALQTGFNMFNHSGLVSLLAFVFSLLTTLVVIFLARLRRASRESIILAGVALSSFFMAGTTFLQYFADETQLAMIVHWTFGDLTRASWPELRLIGAVTLFTSIYFLINRLNYNALLAGDDVAQSLGVNVSRLRLVTMFMASLATSVTVTFFGILGFVGLIAPHMGRRLTGSDNRFLLVLAALLGPLILIFADLFGQFILDPVALPAGVITSFLGTPVFLILLFGKEGE